MELIFVGLVIFGLYKWATRTKETTEAPSSISTAVSAFKTEIEPVVENVKSAGIAAKESYTNAQAQKQAEAALSNPAVVEALLARITSPDPQ